MLVYLERDRLGQFDLESETFRSEVNLRKDIFFNGLSKYTLVDRSQIFCCGDIEHDTTAYLVHVTSGTVEILPSTEFGHTCPGILSHQDSVFVFGSICSCYAALTVNTRTPLQKYAEMFSLIPRVWTRLPDMSTGRHNFTPCVYGLSAYLCTAVDTSIDVFNLQTFSFLDSIPRVADRQNIISTTVSVVINHEMIIITEGSTTIIDLRNFATRSRPSTNKIGMLTSTPAIYQGCVYCMATSYTYWKASGPNFENIQIVQPGR